MSRSTGRALAVASAACLLLAGLLTVVPVSPIDIGSPATTGEPAADLPRPTIPDGSWDRSPYWEIVEANVLSPSREGPDPDGEPWTLAAGSETPGPPVPTAVTTTARPRYRLSGIVGGPDGFVALIDADRRVPGAELYRVGDLVGPYRLTEATDSTVVLDGPGGPQVLRLELN